MLAAAILGLTIDTRGRAGPRDSLRGRAGPCDSLTHSHSRRSALSLAAFAALGSAVRPVAADEAITPAMDTAGSAIRPVAADEAIVQDPAMDKAERFNAIYEDDMHPGCGRRIVVEQLRADEYVAHFHMSDVGPPGIGNVVRLACDETTLGSGKESLRHWTFDARISADGERLDAGDGEAAQPPPSLRETTPPAGPYISI